MNSTRSLFHDNNREKPVRYAVSSLGWVPIAEEDLTPERSNKAVNKCIVDLTLGRNDINDVVGRWGDVSILLVFIELFFNSFLASSNFCHLLITFANSLDTDQDRQNVGCDLDQNCLALR